MEGTTSLINRDSQSVIAKTHNYHIRPSTPPISYYAIDIIGVLHIQYY
jgi:hypothetical protein